MLRALRDGREEDAHFGDLTMTTQTYQGSCHCGKVRFEADLDLTAGSGKCNCSVCTKTRAWSAIIKPAQFRLLAGQNDTSTYVCGAGISKRYFCRHCGVQVYGIGHLAEIGGVFCSINLATLDTDAETLAAIPVRYFDGRNDNWETPPTVIAHL
jgi:hypothetical protein